MKRPLVICEVLLGLQCTKIVHLIAARVTKNVGAYCRQPFARHALQCHGHFSRLVRGVRVPFEDNHVSKFIPLFSWEYKTQNIPFLDFQG